MEADAPDWLVVSVTKKKVRVSPRVKVTGALSGVVALLTSCVRVKVRTVCAPAQAAIIAARIVIAASLNASLS
jgi:hypothetical protein